MDWVHLVQDMGTRWVLFENGKKKIKFQNILGIITRLAEELPFSQREVCCTELKTQLSQNSD